MTELEKCAVIVGETGRALKAAQQEFDSAVASYMAEAKRVADELNEKR